MYDAKSHVALGVDTRSRNAAAVVVDAGSGTACTLDLRMILYEHGCPTVVVLLMRFPTNAQVVDMFLFDESQKTLSAIYIRTQ